MRIGEVPIRTALLSLWIFSVSAAFGQGRKLDAFEKEIVRMEKADAVSPPPKGAVLFVGSSSIKGWKTLERDMAPLPVINRGFGGSTIAEADYYFKRIILKHRPRILVFYSGENDLHSAWLPFDTVIADFNRFRAKMRNYLPGTKCFFISIKHSPSRWNSREKFDRANAMIKEFCDADPQWAFVDVVSYMMLPDGTPDTDLFKSDCLHLNEFGYAIWAREVRKAVLPVWETMLKQPLPKAEPGAVGPRNPDKPTERESWITHTVKSGETLYSIGRKYGVPYARIKEWNGLRSDNIQAGQKLKIRTQNR